MTKPLINGNPGVLYEDQHLVDPPSPWVHVNENHQYKVQGLNLNPKGVELPMPSVSTIAGLTSGFDGRRWAGKLAMEYQDPLAYQKVSAGYAETGNMHHRHIRNIALSGNTEKYMESLTTKWGINYEMISGWLLWMQERGINPEKDFIATEMYVYNEAMNYGGQLDAIIQYQGTPTIFDWKTTTENGASIKEPSHAVQVGGYYLALQEMMFNHKRRFPDAEKSYDFDLPTQAFVSYSFRDAPRKMRWEKVDLKAAVEVFQQAHKIHSGKAKGGLYVKSPAGGW